MNAVKEPARILVVDDEDRNRRLLVAMLEAEGYAALEAAGGAQALELARQSPPDIILLDNMMPGMDGYEVARALKADAATKAIPVVMVTALDDRDSRLRGLEAGAEEFITKPVDRNELRIRVRNLLRLKEFSDFLANHNRILDTQVKERTRQLAASYRETIATMTRAASYKDEETGAHVARISFYTVELARSLGLDAEFCDVIHYASPMHDVGKIA
ncbi:MAG: response regulator, partial [Legionella sp.]|nr:response regulator [Legionella sp.]